MIAIIDYGMGNLRSVQKAFEHIGAQAQITQNPNELKTAAKVVLPGVGAMQPAMRKLKDLGLLEPIKECIKSQKPFLGICLGYQLLFETSHEGGKIKGLGLLKGTVQRFKSLKIPQMGWNQIKIQQKKCPLFKNVPNSTNVYFCHSYFVHPKDAKIISTTTDYGVSYASSVHHDNIFGVQFHPEKSQDIGLTILKNFYNL